ncbi:peptidase S8/S53 domain-containing protein [Tribonema minus]|uniref:subtilisin n=1 Tax=Tribonema minus TaxID=303371 RepID=A0A836CPN5_9STRA|nr:peptidase S8/S53 domain-containing protein [Tribonema minus]
MVLLVKQAFTLTLLVALHAAAADNYSIRAAGLAFGDDLQFKVAKAGAKITSVFPDIGMAFVETTVAAPAFQAALLKISGIAAVTPAAWWPAANPARVLQDDLKPQMRALVEEASGKSGSLSRHLTGPITIPPQAVQWNMQAINAPAAWAAGFTGGPRTGKKAVRRARVAVLDTGFFTGHESVAPNLNLALSKSFVNIDGERDTVEHLTNRGTFSHGTHVAGIIAGADLGPGSLKGVAPDAELVFVKVLSDVLGYGLDEWVLKGIMYAADLGVDVINMSLGDGVLYKRGAQNTISTDSASVNPSPQSLNEYRIMFIRAAQYAAQKGVTIVASAGNEYFNFDGAKGAFTMPATIPKVLTISATGPINWFKEGCASGNCDRPSVFTNFGVSAVTVAAPGGGSNFPGTIAQGGDGRPDLPLSDMDSECSLTLFHGLARTIPCFALDFVLSAARPDNAYGWAAGTSMAAPHVAGLAALIVSASAKRPSPTQVLTALKQCTDDLGKSGADPYYGAGRINAGKIVSLKL